MLGVARALTGHPRALLADELSLGLAPMIVERLLIAIRESARTRGTAVLLVEQQVRQALLVADRGYVLQRGEGVLEGTGSELLDQMSSIEAKYLSGLDGYADGGIVPGAGRCSSGFSPSALAAHTTLTGHTPP